MLKTYKDILFWILTALWAICISLSYFVFNIDPIYVNLTFILIFCILIFVQSVNDKFTDWLMKPINKPKK